MPKHPNDLTLSQVRYFVRAAELGSMTEAAAELFVAQSAVSTAIAQLETTLGCKLFIRQRSRGVVLTEQGRTFYASAHQILNSVDDAVDSLRPEQLSGTLVAGCYTTLAPFWLPEVYESLTSVYPELDVRISEVKGEDVESLLLRREMEVILTYGFDYGRGIDFEQLSDAPVYAAVAQHSPLSQRDEITLEELAAEPLILLDISKGTNYFLSLFREAHLQPQIQERFESYEVVRSMVARGHGYTILNQRPAHDLTNDGQRLVRLPITDVKSYLQIGIAYRRGEQLSRKAHAFVEECRQIFS